MAPFVARTGMRTIDRNFKQLWRDGWVQIPELMVGGGVVLFALAVFLPSSLHKLRAGPREHKYRHKYEVIRKDEIPPYLRDFPDCLNWARTCRAKDTHWRLTLSSNLERFVDTVIFANCLFIDIFFLRGSTHFFLVNTNFINTIRLKFLIFF